MNQSTKKFHELIREIENHPGHQLDNEAGKLESSFKLMVVNYSHLKTKIEHIPVFDYFKDRDKKERYMLDATRLFLNFITSAAAFSDHTRVYVRKLYGDTKTAFDGEYQRKVDENFKNDELSQFIEGIRNYYCHFEIPPLGLRTTFPEKKSVTRFTLFTENIDTLSHPKTKKFVENGNSEFVDVLDLCDKYLNKTVFVWIMQEQFKLHKKEYTELETLRKFARELYNEPS